MIRDNRFRRSRSRVRRPVAESAENPRLSGEGQREADELGIQLLGIAK